VFGVAVIRGLDYQTDRTVHTNANEGTGYHILAWPPTLRSLRSPASTADRSCRLNPQPTGIGSLNRQRERHETCTDRMPEGKLSQTVPRNRTVAAAGGIPVAFEREANSMDVAENLTVPAEAERMVSLHIKRDG
jgi:hypothetical protein